MFKCLLVLSSTKLAETIPMVLPSPQKSGTHIESRSRGRYFIEHRLGSTSVLIPQRSKEITIYCDESDTSKVVSEIEQLDSKYLELVQREKYSIACNNVLPQKSVLLENTGTHGTFGILVAPGEPVYRYGILYKGAVYLYLSTEDLVPHPEFYYFRFQPLESGAMFVPTQPLCSKWWRWSKLFENDTFKMFNALEAWIRKH